MDPSGSGATEAVGLPLGVLVMVIDCARRCLDADNDIKTEGRRLSTAVELAMDLRRKRIQVQSSVRWPGDQAHPRIRELFRLEKRIWGELIGINNMFARYLGPARLDLATSMKGGASSARGGKIPWDVQVMYGTFNKVMGQDDRHERLQALETSVEQMLKELKESESKETM